MRNLLVLGAGTAGTMIANKLRRKLHRDDWAITVVDRDDVHPYQPGFLFLPFGTYTAEQVVRSRHAFLTDGVEFVIGEVDKVDADASSVSLLDGRTLAYDYLVIASGTSPRPDQTEGMLGGQWRRSVYDFYTLEGSKALGEALKEFDHGRLVVHITEMPIKCPVAPLEFSFLADSYFKNKKMRDKVDITYVTPLSGAFTKPKATETLSHLLVEKNINQVNDFGIKKVDNENKKIIDYEGREVSFDLLVTVPTNKGDALIERSGLGDDLNFVPTNKATLQSLEHPDIFVLGDATNIPASKAGSVTHFEAEILTENILRYVKGEPLKEEFDGHANCFVETGNGKALLIDFNYTHEPVEGTFPFPGIGPLRLLKESRMNHMGKLAFRWIYWHMLLKGTHIPFVSTTMQMEGKHF